MKLVPGEIEDHQRAKLAEFRWNRAFGGIPHDRRAGKVSRGEHGVIRNRFGDSVSKQLTRMCGLVPTFVGGVI